MTPAVAQWLAKQTPATRELFDERAAIMEFDAGMTRAEAEKRAMEMIIERRSSNGQ